MSSVFCFFLKRERDVNLFCVANARFDLGVCMVAGCDPG